MGIVTSYMRAFNTNRIDPYPVQVLNRVDRPTVLIKEEEIHRVDGRNSGFNRAFRGEFGPYLQKERTRIVKKHPLGAALSQMQSNLKDMVHCKLAPNKAPIPEDPAEITRHIKETAYFLRADMVGICKLPPYAVLSHGLHDGAPVECDHKYAIAVLMDQDWKTSEASFGNDWISGAMSYVGYTNSGFIARILADYIRMLGYPARAHHALNYQVLVPPILVWSGLGEMSRIGDIVVNPFLGPRFKAAVVTTDLPLIPDKPIDFGLQDFCTKCKKCARECPSGAISFGDKIFRNGYERWPLDVEKCASMRIGNKAGASCGVCMTVCPWNKPFTPFHRFVMWLMRTIPTARRFAIWGDDMMGYGIPKVANKWWLDLEEVDGVLHIPSRAGMRKNMRVR